MHRQQHTQTRIPLLILLLLIVGIAAIAPAAALKVDGARIALEVTPGQTTTSPIGVSIGMDETEGDFAIDVLGFGQSVADGTYNGLEASADISPYSARSFITIDKPTVHLKHGERADATATIRVPADAKDGGRYALILVHPATAASGQQTSFATAVAIPVLLTVKGGTIVQKGEITTIETSKADTGKPFSVTATVKNSGNYHYYGVVSNVTVNDGQEKTVATVKTTPMSRAIIPNNLVKISAQVSPGLPEGMYQVTVKMETQDGTVLDTETKALQVGNAKSGPVAESKVAGVRTTYAPGPGVLAVCIAVSLGIFGGIKIRQKKE